MSDINRELRAEIEQEVNAISVNSDLAEMPEGMGILIPSADLQKSIERIMLILSTAQNKARIDELEKLKTRHTQNNTGTDCSVVNVIVADRLNQLKKEEKE